MGRLWLALGGSVAALLCMLYMTARHVWQVESDLRTANARIELLQQAQELANQIEADALAAKKAQDEQNALRFTEMENVLRGNDDWSNTALPDDVIRLLRQGTDSGASTLPAAGDVAR